MIELLTVIAIIAILAGITFPVFSRVRANAYRSADISNMNDIRNAIQLYRADQEAYPPQLLGYASLYFGGPNDGQVVPADQARGFLYPKREPLGTLQPSQDRVDFKSITNAVWPNQDPRAVGSAPQVDLNGDGKIDASDDTAGARQAFGTGKTVTRVLSASDFAAERASFGRDENIDHASAQSDGSYLINSYFYDISGYDVAKVKIPSATRTELRYTLFWTVFGLGGGDKDDDPRQLGYSEPPENTVVTWNSWWRDYDQSGNPQRGKQEVVLFLGGGAKPADSVDVNTYSWRTLP